MTILLSKKTDLELVAHRAIELNFHQKYGWPFRILPKCAFVETQLPSVSHSNFGPDNQ